MQESSAGWDADIQTKFWNIVTPTIASNEVAIEILDNFVALRVVGADVLDAIEVKVIVFS